MTLDSHASFLHTHAYVVKLRRDSDPARGHLVGRLEHVDSGRARPFPSAAEPLPPLQVGRRAGRRTAERPRLRPARRAGERLVKRGLTHAGIVLALLLACSVCAAQSPRIRVGVVTDGPTDREIFPVALIEHEGANV